MITRTSFVAPRGGAPLRSAPLALFGGHGGGELAATHPPSQLPTARSTALWGGPRRNYEGSPRNYEGSTNY